MFDIVCDTKETPDKWGAMKYDRSYPPGICSPEGISKHVS